MADDNVLTLRINGKMRKQIDDYAKKRKISASALAKEALGQYLESLNRQQLREKDVEKALEAFDRWSGSVSHGSLAQNIDDELYGPVR